MKYFASIQKAVKAGSAAYKKSKADDIAAAAKKAKETEEKAKQAKKLKDAYDTGVKAGKKKGAKSVKRKIAAGAAVAGAGYVESKTGAISEGIKKLANKAEEAYRTRNATKQSHTKAPVKAKAGMKDAIKGPRGGVKEIVKKAKSTAKKQTKDYWKNKK